MNHLILHRLYRSNVLPFRSTINQRGSKPTTLAARSRDGGFEISVYPQTMEGFNQALQEIMLSHAIQAYLAIYEGDTTTGEVVESWMLEQIALQRAKRLV